MDKAKITVAVDDRHIIQTKNSFAYMGLSLGKQLFENKNVMQFYSRFLSENFSESFFLIADLPKKYNIMAIEGVSEDEALKRINNTSQKYKIFLERMTEGFPNISIKHYAELQDENYFHNIKVLREAYLKDLKFRLQVRKDVVDFLSLPNNKKKIDSSQLSFNESVDIAINYRIDELALLLAIPCKYDKLYEVYPGVDPLHERLHEGKFEFCKNLKQNPRRKFLEVYHEN
jgi:tRNA-dependent cyclodipeptide synthase